MTDNSEELRALNAILQKLGARGDVEDASHFSKDEMTAIRRVMLTEPEAVALRHVIQFSMGASAIMQLLKMIRSSVVVLGALVAGYIAVKSGLIEWIRGVAK